MAYTEFELDLIFSQCEVSYLGIRTGYGTDCDGRTIKRSEYGRRTAEGWQVDHVVPFAFGGLDHISNMRPRHWQGNQAAGGLLGLLVRGLDEARRPASTDGVSALARALMDGPSRPPAEVGTGAIARALMERRPSPPVDAMAALVRAFVQAQTPR